MKFTAYLATAAAAFGIVDAQCNANNCARAVTGTRLGPATQAARRADCSSYQRTTITLARVTETVIFTSSGSAVTRTFASSTVTTTTTVTPFIPTITIDLPEPTFKRREIEDRQLVSTSLPEVSPIPFYASACAGPSAYRSACSCWGITPTFVFATVESTTTFSFTSIERDTITVIGTGVTTTTVRITSTPDVSSDVGPSSTDEPTVTTEEPVSSTDEPVSPTEEPASSTEEPASSTEEPVSTTDEPVPTSSDEPATSTDEPPVTTDEPVPTSSDEPATSTDEPPVTTDEPVPTSSDEPATTTDEPATTTDEPPVTTDEPASSTEEPASTTEEPASSTEEPASTTDEVITLTTATEEPSITEEPVTTTDDPIISLTFFTNEPSTTDPAPSLPTTFVTSFTTIVSEDPSSTTSSDSTAPTGADICSTFGSRFPYTPLNLITLCSCTYENPVCGEGFASVVETTPAALTIEDCANVCDGFTNCGAFSYNPETLVCRSLARGTGIGFNSSSTWVFVDRQFNSCGSAQCS